MRGGEANRMISNASGGNGNADQQFCHADAPASRHGDALVGTAFQHAAAGDGVTVHRGHHGLGKEKHRVIGAGAAAVQEAPQHRQHRHRSAE